MWSFMQKTVSIKKRVAFYLLFVLSVYILTELFVFIGYFLIHRELFSWSHYQAMRNAVITASSMQFTADDQQNPPESGTIQDWGGAYEEVIHPYLGFVANPRKVTWIAEYGFKSNPLEGPHPEDALTIAIVGGSFAQGTSIKLLRTVLQESPVFQGKDIILHNLALGGYKQPQQLFTISYFLTLGAHFDIVINIDGFNEVALPVVENTSKHVSPFFPRNWFLRVSTFRDPEIITTIGEISVLSKRQRRWAELFAKRALRYTIACNLIWEYYNNTLVRQQVGRKKIIEHYETQQQENVSYLVSGPFFSYANDAQLYKDLADVWMRSSIQLHRLCSTNGIAYFHFLQPNQYVPDSKIMGEAELKKAYEKSHPYKKGVEKGYPYLIEEGKYLQELGVKFYDLTMIFTDHVEPLYADTCCHLNVNGGEIVTRTIGNTIITEFQNKVINLP